MSVKKKKEEAPPPLFALLGSAEPEIESELVVEEEAETVADVAVVEDAAIGTTDDGTQPQLFDVGAWYENHWKGMPEFDQKDLAPKKSIYVHFEDRAGMDAFAKLVGQRITMDTRSIWYPEAEIGRMTDRRYIDSPNISPNKKKLPGTRST